MMQQKRKKSPVGRILLIIVGAGVLILIATTLFRKEPKPQVTLEKVEKRTLVASVSESGTVQPAIEVKVAPDVSGEIVELRFHEGDYVKKGDLLVTIKPDNYKSALEQATAAVNSSQANHLQAKSALSQAQAKQMQDSATFRRNDDLFRQKMISQAEWENYRLQLEVSRSQLESAQQQVQATYFQVQSSRASLEQARQNLNKTSIYASMDGIVTLQNVEVGERVVGTMQMQGTEMLRVADLSRMEVKVNISENDVVNLSVGDSASVEVDAYRDMKFYGRVTEIAYSAQTTSAGTTDQITNFQVKVEIDPRSYSGDEKLMRGKKAGQSPFRPGMSARVQIFTEKRDDILTVPIQAVMMKKKDPSAKTTSSPQTGTEIVYVWQDGKVKEAEVKTGISDDKYIEVKSGLKGGETIATGPYLVLVKDLKDGMEVEQKKEDKEKEGNGKESGSQND